MNPARDQKTSAVQPPTPAPSAQPDGSLPPGTQGPEQQRDYHLPKRKDADPAAPPQEPQEPRQRTATSRAGQSPHDGKLPRENGGQAPLPTKGLGGVKITSAEDVPSRDGPKADSCTVWGLPLETVQKNDSPKGERVCGYHRCGVPLRGMSRRAKYCRRRHKEAAKQARNRRQEAPRPRTGSCSVCGIAVAVESRRGALPKYCPQHHPKQPCAGCGKKLRHYAASQFCRSCQATRCPVNPERIWTCLCDTCGALFEAPSGTNFCDKHTTTKEDHR